MTKPNSTEIVFVVDRSGSMSSIATDMVGGFGTFIAEQKKLPGECRVTLTQFDNHYDVVYEGRPISEVPTLELVPRGGTALLDAVGRTIDAVGSRLRAMSDADRPSKVLFVIITDGHENASREYNRQRVFDMIKTQRDTFAWEFVFLGADQDAIGAAVDLGIAGSNAVNYQASARGAHALFSGLSNNAASYRSNKGFGDAQASYNAAIGGGGAGSNTAGGSGQVYPDVVPLGGTAPTPDPK